MGGCCSASTAYDISKKDSFIQIDLGDATVLPQSGLGRALAVPQFNLGDLEWYKKELP